MDFLQLLHRFVPPYRGHLVLNILFNLLSTVLSLFSFAAIIPVLQILFGIATVDTEYITITADMGFQGFFDAAKNNVFYWLEGQIDARGAGFVLFILGAFLVVATGLKCACAYFASYHMIPIRTGVLRDLRQQLYNKIVSLPVGYFTQERKGDIMSRMTNDVAEVENSIMAMLEMIFKNPIMILIYLIKWYSIYIRSYSCMYIFISIKRIY